MFEDFFQALIREIRKFSDENLSLGGPMQRLHRQLRVMYGRGEISREVFFQMRGRLERDQNIEGELKVLHRKAASQMEAEGRAPVIPQDAELARGLDQMHLGRAMLEEARFDMQRILKTAQTEREWMKTQAEEMLGRAQSALPDEAEARAYIETRLDLLQHAQTLERRIQAFQQDLHKLDTLEARIKLYEAELLIAASREQLAYVDLSLEHNLRL